MTVLFKIYYKHLVDIFTIRMPDDAMVGDLKKKVREDMFKYSKALNYDDFNLHQFGDPRARMDPAKKVSHYLVWKNADEAIDVEVTIDMCEPRWYFDTARMFGPSIPKSVKCNARDGTVTAIDLPAGPYIGQRTSDGKYQLIFSNMSTNRTHIGYFIVYNGDDPTATVFSTIEEANDYLNTDYVNLPPSKVFDDHSSEDVKTSYSSFIAVSAYPSSYILGRQEMRFYD